MKKMMILLTAAIMTMPTFAQSAAELAKQQQELRALHMKMLNAKPSKSAKKEAKELKNNNWQVPAGSLSIEQQITQSQLYQQEFTVNDNGETIKRFIVHPAMQTSGSYNAGYAAARAAAQTEIAGMLKTQLTAAMKNKLDNAQNSAVTATTVDKFNQRAGSIIDGTLTNAIPVVAIYRVLPNNNYQVQVTIALDKKEWMARIKQNMQKELEVEGDHLNSVVDEAFNNAF